MCNNTDRTSKTSQKSEKQQEQQHQQQASLHEKARELGTTVNQQASEAKEEVKSKATEMKQKASEKTDDARDYTAKKIGDLKEAIEPLTEEPEPKTLGDRIGDAGSSVLEKAKTIVSNLHPHPDEEKKNAAANETDHDKKEDEKKEDDLHKVVLRHAEDEKSKMERLGEDTRRAAEENTEAARLWTAEKLGQIQNTVAPEKNEEEEKPKTVGDRVQEAGSTVVNKANDIIGSIGNKLHEFGADNDPHEDPKLREQKPSGAFEKISNDLFESKPKDDTKDDAN